MLERRQIGSIVYYASPLLEAIGVPHGFSTRLGGISPAPFDSMNLGNPSGCALQDDEPRISENYRLLQTAIGFGDRQRFWVHQVHGGEVVNLTGDVPLGRKADAVVTREPNRVLAIRVADCVPILLATKDGRCVAAVHAGWRGVIAGAVANAVRVMDRSTATAATATSTDSLSRGAGNEPSPRAPRRDAHLPNNLIAAIGPCIGFESFEVGPEVLAEFERAFPAAPPIKRYSDGSGKGTVDLRAAVRQQLLDLGVPDGQIDTTDRCTVQHKEEFFSHRRDAGVAGRMAALIATRQKG